MKVNFDPGWSSSTGLDLCSIHVVYFFMACSIFLLYLDDVKRSYEKIEGLVIWDWYFSGRMEYKRER